MKKYLFVLSAILLIGITFSAVQIIKAATSTITPTHKPDPGHSWSQIGNFDCTAGNCLQKNYNGTLTCVSCGGGAGLWTQGAGDDIYYNTGAGNVGIGTDNPQAKLDVAGAIKIDTAPHFGATIKTDGFACVDMDSISIGDDGCRESNRGMIRIRKTNCGGDGYRDSLCYCGLYEKHPTTAIGCNGDWCWICLISCP